MVIEFLQNAEFWHWWAFGFAFLILEMLAPGFILLWFGVSAFLVGVLLTFVDLSPHMQLSIWAGLSIVDILMWRAIRKKIPQTSDDSLLNQRGQQYVGRQFTLEEATSNGYGKIKVDDTTWKILVEDDIEAGKTVTVTGVEGVILKAEVAE